MLALRSTIIAVVLMCAGSALLTRPVGAQTGKRTSTAPESNPIKRHEQSSHPLEWVDVEEANSSSHRVRFAERVKQVSAEYPVLEPGLHNARAGNPYCCVETYWVRADYLHWWLDGAAVPVLVTTSPAGTDRNDAGVLGLPTTSVLFGGEEQGTEDRSGGRIEIGRWFEQRGGLGWHFAYFGVEDSNDRGRFDSSTIPILARPFFSVEPANVGQNAQLVAFPGELEGRVSIDHTTSFEGAELMFRWMLADSRDRRLQFVAGYQYTALDDGLAINDFQRVIGGSSGLAIGTTLAGNDHFRTENRFNGAALGLLASARNCRTSLDVGMQLALGNTNSKVGIIGSTTSSVPTPGGGTDTATTLGGLLALPSNIGLYENDEFAVVPQLHVAVGYDFHPQVRGTLGYSFLYWSQVARASEQVDTSVNLSQLDPGGLNGEARPRFDFLLSDFWAQGINLGLDYRF